ncbi:MAG: PrgI family protein [Lachnospiraceae bacterium]|nr:PrgI family protein [Lachnospiraceae bacterium]
MAYVPVPKDLTKVKTKVMFNLTKRQLLCFGGGIVLGLPIFFLTKNMLGTSVSAMLMIIIMLPCFLLALYEKHGQPLEKVVKNIIEVCFLRPKVRPYMSNNFYDCLLRQDELDKEVKNIVSKEFKPGGQKSH